MTFYHEEKGHERFFAIAQNTQSRAKKIAFMLILIFSRIFEVSIIMEFNGKRMATGHNLFGKTFFFKAMRERDGKVEIFTPEPQEKVSACLFGCKNPRTIKP